MLPARVCQFCVLSFSVLHRELLYCLYLTLGFPPVAAGMQDRGQSRAAPLPCWLWPSLDDYMLRAWACLPLMCLSAHFCTAGMEGHLPRACRVCLTFYLDHRGQSIEAIPMSGGLDLDSFPQQLSMLLLASV